MILNLAGSARLAPYLQEADGDDERACELYLWVTDLAGALFSTIAFVEVGLRNSMDRKLRVWNDKQGCRTLTECPFFPIVYPLLIIPDPKLPVH